MNTNGGGGGDLSSAARKKRKRQPEFSYEHVVAEQVPKLPTIIAYLLNNY